jgi:hypothetical protein
MIDAERIPIHDWRSDHAGYEFRLKLLGKYDVPEIAHLSAFHPTRDPSAGVRDRRAFSFLYRREGRNRRRPRPSCLPWRHQWDRTAISSAGYRCLHDGAAVGCGTEIRQQTRVADIDIQQDVVTLVPRRVKPSAGAIWWTAPGSGRCSRSIRSA